MKRAILFLFILHSVSSFSQGQEEKQKVVETINTAVKKIRAT